MRFIGQSVKAGLLSLNFASSYSHFFMRLQSLLLLLTLLHLTAAAQVTIQLTSVPSNTPATDTIYLAGSVNNWNPASASYALTRTADGTYSITLPAVTGTMEYKFTRGSWSKAETTLKNEEAGNRSYTFGSGPATVKQQVLNWKDLAGGGPAAPRHTTTANVQVMTEAFTMPDLNGRTRRIWLYLPTGYSAGTQHYPVLYLQDGQNVFDTATSFSGEWGVDETLSQLQAAGLNAARCIVVAIDNGGASRLDEYSPWRNTKYGGGEGDKYLDFLVKTLKPYIDKNYRTKPSRTHTGIGGSSMGALIATYAALRHPTIFGKVAAFSPAYWFAEKQLFDYVRQHRPNPHTRFYFLSGTKESETMVPLMTAMRDALQAGGVPPANLGFRTCADGQHAEWFWKREFEAGYQWLFAPVARGHSPKRRS
jgi:predicted alpha/beta superfamily hydrolase